MSNPIVKKDLLDAILELRADVEKQLQANKYYVALGKLDELLAAIKPLEIIEATAQPVASTEQDAETAAPAEQEAETAAPAPGEPEAEPTRTWSGIVQQSVVEGEAARP
jgi:hypothetical protein